MSRSDQALTTQALRVLLADEDEAALRRTGALIEGLGHEVVSSAVNLAEATEAIAREDPDVSIVLVHTDDEHALDLIEEIGAFSRGPVIALMSNEDERFVARAAERGVDAYARPTTAQAIQGAIEFGLRRHRDTQALTDQVQHLQTALERRSVIERAKGIVMEREGCDERAAFERLRSQARSESATVLAVAHAVIAGRRLG